MTLISLTGWLRDVQTQAQAPRARADHPDLVRAEFGAETDRRVRKMLRQDDGLRHAGVDHSGWQAEVDTHRRPAWKLNQPTGNYRQVRPSGADGRADIGRLGDIADDGPVPGAVWGNERVRSGGRSQDEIR